MNAVTNAELDAFYGVAPTQYERSQAIKQATRAFDADDLIQIAAENPLQIMRAMTDSDEVEIGRLFVRCAKVLIAHRASNDLYGKSGLIKPSEVTL